MVHYDYVQKSYSMNQNFLLQDIFRNIIGWRQQGQTYFLLSVQNLTENYF